MEEIRIPNHFDKSAFDRTNRSKQRRAASPKIVRERPSSFRAIRKNQSAFRRALLLALADISMIGIGLLIFAYFHHVRLRSYSTDDAIVVSGRSAMNDSFETSVSDASSSTAAPDDWTAKFSARSTDGGVETTQNSYRSEHIAITIEKHADIDEGGDSQVWFVADVYLSDIELFRTAFAEDTYGKGFKDMVQFIAYQHDGILAINGDYYGMRENGVVIRNGVVYRSDTFKDVCILYYDGVMETMAADEFHLTTPSPAARIMLPPSALLC